MSKVIKVGNHGEAQIYCPACQRMHGLRLEPHPQAWNFNEDYDKPTFSPSLLVKVYTPEEIICHSFIKDGMIQFLSDCTHNMAGKTVELENIE